MVSANNFNAGYAEALVLGTLKDKLAQPEKPKIKAGLSAEEIGKIARGWNPLSTTSKQLRNSKGKTC
jgi:hypothetical protein